MNRLTDAVPPESDLARDFNRRVDQALANPAGLRAQSAELRRWLMLWRENHALLQPLLQQSFLLRELEPVSENVMALAAAGLQALEYLESGAEAVPNRGVATRPHSCSASIRRRQKRRGGFRRRRQSC